MKKFLLFILAVGLSIVSYAQYWNVVLNFDNGKYGVIDSLGRPVLPSIYLVIEVIDPSFAVVTDSLYKKGVVNNLGKIVVPFKYDNIEPFYEPKSNTNTEDEKDLFKIHNFNKVGVYKIDKGEIIPCKFDDVNSFSCQNSISDIFSVLTYKSLYHPKHRFVEVKLKDKWGVVDSLFNYVLPCEYQQFGVSYKDVVLAKKNNKWGALSLTSKKDIIDFNFDTIYKPILFDQLTQNYVFTVQVNDSVFVVNSSGQKFFIPQNIASYFSLINPEFGYVNSSNEEKIDLYFFNQNKILPTNYLPYEGFALWDNSTIFSMPKYKSIVIDATGKEVYKLKNNMGKYYSGNFVLGNRYFFDGSKLYEKTLNGVVEKYTISNVKLKELDDLLFNNSGLIVVQQNKKFGLILKENDTIKEILPCEYDKINYSEDYSDNSSGSIIIQKNKLCGLVILDNDKLKWAIPIEYENIEQCDHPLYFVKKNGKFGIYLLSFGLKVKCEYKSKNDASKLLLRGY